MAEDDDAGVINMDAASKWDELKTRGIIEFTKLHCISLHSVRRKVFKKRSLAKLNFSIGTDIEIAVRLYNLTQETKKVRAKRKLYRYLCHE